jgi:aminoglycoside phosphotransferase family enzyme
MTDWTERARVALLAGRDAAGAATDNTVAAVAAALADAHRAGERAGLGRAAAELRAVKAQFNADGERAASHTADYAIDRICALLPPE